MASSVGDKSGLSWRVAPRTARASPALLLPWLCMAAASVLLPWLSYRPLGLGDPWAGLGKDLMAALWLVLAGAVLAAVLAR